MIYSIGDTLQSGKFQIVAILGQGGFGITYLVEHTLMGKKFAVKQFYPSAYFGASLGNNSAPLSEETVALLRKRFMKEARALESCEHSGIVRIRDVFTEPSGDAFYTMDYIPGRSLKEIVTQEGPLPRERVLRYINQVADALSYVHSQGMLHLDIKPANILIDESKDRAVLIDFGLVRNFGKANALGNSTTGISGLSAGYAAIEQYNNQKADFTPATDVYALAATTYALLTGKTPPASPDISAGADLNQLFAQIADPQLRAAIAHGMQLSIPLRPATVADFLRELNAPSEAAASIPTQVIMPKNVAADDATEIVSKPTVTPHIPDVNNHASPGAPKRKRSKATMWIVIVTAACVILGGVGAWLLLRGSSNRNSDDDESNSVTIPASGVTNNSGPVTITTDQIMASAAESLSANGTLDLNQFRTWGTDLRTVDYKPILQDTNVTLANDCAEVFYYTYDSDLKLTETPGESDDFSVMVSMEGVEGKDPTQLSIQYLNVPSTATIVAKLLAIMGEDSNELRNNTWNGWEILSFKYPDFYIIISASETDHIVELVMGQYPEIFLVGNGEHIVAHPSDLNNNIVSN